MLIRPLLAVALAVSAGIALAQTAPSGIERIPLQTLDYPAGYSTVIGLAEIAPGASAGRHTHPGMESGYVLEGEFVLAIEGEPERILKAGESYQVPAGVVHDAKTYGDKPMKVIATYIVEKGKPLASPAPAK